MDNRTLRLIAAGLASEHALAQLDIEEVLAAREAPMPTVRTHSEAPTVLQGRRLRYVWSTETVDRMGDIVRQEWDLGGFTKNPMALWNHDHDEVLGRSPSYGVEFVNTKRRLAGDIEFPPEGTAVNLDTRYKLAAAGFLPATSVGFMPKAIDKVTDKAKRKDLGLGAYGVVFERSELLEISVVSVPANPDAVRESVQRGVLTADEAEVAARDAQLTERDWFKRLERMATKASAARAPTEHSLTLADVERLLDDHAAELRRHIDAALKRTPNTEPQGDRSKFGALLLDEPLSGRGADTEAKIQALAAGVARSLASKNGQTK